MISSPEISSDGWWRASHITNLKASSRMTFATKFGLAAGILLSEHYTLQNFTVS
jgi:hypothetical protein